MSLSTTSVDFYPLVPFLSYPNARKRTKRTFALFIYAFIKLIKPQLHKNILKAKKCLKSPKNRHKCPITTPYTPPPGNAPWGGGGQPHFKIFLFFSNFFYFFIFLLLWNKFTTKYLFFALRGIDFLQYLYCLVLLIHFRLKVSKI